MYREKKEIERKEREKERERERERKKTIDDYSKVLFACIRTDVMCGCASLFNIYC